MLSDLSLLIQILAFSFLLYAIYRRKESLASHGKIASIAFYLALPAVFYMLYSKSRGFTLPNYNSLLGLHMLLGILTILTGTLFVTNQWKWKVKKNMDLEIVLWTGTFLLGITIYILLFSPVLF
jgi:EamA domain-containing membrane protein RarD